VKCVVGIDLGSTTTKAIVLDEHGNIVGQGITNSRSNYEVACAVAREEAVTSTRFSLLERARAAHPDGASVKADMVELQKAYRLELFLEELKELSDTMLRELDRSLNQRALRPVLRPAAEKILERTRVQAPAQFLGNAPRRSDFFRDLASAAFNAGAEEAAKEGSAPFEPLIGLFDRAILQVETRVVKADTSTLLRRAVQRVPEGSRAKLDAIVAEASKEPIDEISFTGTGYGRQTLPFPKSAIRSEILCHGRGAHRRFNGTRTVLDIGGQDTKGIQVDDRGVVTSFQMNDRCAAGCGRYLGYIADELGLGLHELGPLAMQHKRVLKVNSTCTVFAGAELRERLSLGQRREDVLAGLHRSIMLRAMSIIARSGGITDEFTFTGGVCKNEMATTMLRQLVAENYGSQITINIDPDSIYMGALGAALFALDDVREGRPAMLPAFVANAANITPPIDLESAAACVTEH
jgi:benzoyl-CoA reductase subunit A